MPNKGHINFSDCLWVGFWLGHVSANIGVHLGQDADVLERYRSEIDDLDEYMNDLGLDRSRKLVIAFLEQVGDMEQNLLSLTDEVAQDVKERMAEHEERRRVELAELKKSRGLPQPKALPEGMRNAIAPHLYDSLPSLTRQDFDEAKRCLVDGNNNGGVLLLVRSVEVAFKAYYGDVTGRHPGTRSWDKLEEDMTGALYDPYVMNAMRDVRKNFRNPVTHPERDYVLSDEEMVRTFYACSEALVRLAERKFKKEMPLSA